MFNDTNHPSFSDNVCTIIGQSIGRILAWGISSFIVALATKWVLNDFLKIWSKTL